MEKIAYQTFATIGKSYRLMVLVELVICLRERRVMELVGRIFVINNRS